MVSWRLVLVSPKDSSRCSLKIPLDPSSLETDVTSQRPAAPTISLKTTNQPCLPEDKAAFLPLSRPGLADLSGRQDDQTSTGYVRTHSAAAYVGTSVKHP